MPETKQFENTYKNWLNKSHTAIETGYKSAITHYDNQKKAFLNLLNLTGKEAIENFLGELQLAMIQELETDDELLNSFDSGFAEIKGMIEQAIANKMAGQNSSLDALTNQLKNKKGKKENESFASYRSRTKILTDFMEKDFGINRQDYLNAFNKKIGFVTTDGAAQNLIFGYARKVLYNKMTQKENEDNANSLKHILKGYYKETLATNALIKVLQKYNKSLTAVQTGNVKDDKNLSIIYDILIGKSENLIGKTDNQLYQFSQQIENIAKLITGEESAESGNGGGFGAQSKSWVAPWDTKEGKIPNLYFLEVAHREELKPIAEDAYYWHAGVYNAMLNMLSVIGLQQTLFFTGNRPYFTTDLLAQFKEENYVLAFGMDKDPEDTGATRKLKIIKNAIYFRLHNDSKYNF